MKIEVLSESQSNKLRLAVREADENFLNALRRAVNSEIPAFAIDEVAFYENTSPLFNEYVANRLALVPLTFEEGVQSGAAISLSLEAEASEGPRIVYSRELQSSDPVIRVFCERIPVMKLGKGQKLKLEATVTQGRGRQHAKFQSALASYGALPDFRVSGKCDKCGECVGACPKKIISPQIKLSDAGECVLCENCAESCPKQALTVRPKEGEFVFSVESFNNLTAREQLERALKLVSEKIDFAEEGVRNPKKLEKREEAARAAQAAAEAAKVAEQAARTEAEAKAEEEGIGAAGAAGAAEAPSEGVDEGIKAAAAIAESGGQAVKEKKERKRKSKKAEKEGKEKNSG